MPPIRAIETAKPSFGLAWLSGSHDTLPRGRQAGQVLRVDRSRPVPVLRLFRREACVVKVVLVEELGGAIRTRRPCQRGNGVDDQLEVTFTRAQSIFGPLPIVDVRQQDAPPNDLSV